ELDRDFLNRVSRLIRQVPAPHPELLVEIFQEDGMQATLRDVNRTDNRTRLMATRQFARTGGIPLVHDALNNGRIVVLPQEYKEGLGFVMIYGRTEDGFFAVDFLHGHHGYRRGHVEAREVARRWITRAERAYRLDLIQIVPPPAIAESYATPPPR